MIDNTVGGVDLSDVDFRLKRAADILGHEWQEIRIEYSVRTTWSWLFETNVDRATLTFSDNVLGFGDTWNDDLRIFNFGNHQRVDTRAVPAHNEKQGFAYGNTIQGVENDNPHTFLWEHASESGALPYSEIYLRVPSCAADGSYCGLNALSCDDSAGPAVCTCNESATGKRCDQCTTGYQDNDGDGRCSPQCGPSDCTLAGELCVDGSGTASCIEAEYRSCLEIKAATPGATDGFYDIAPKSASALVNVWCDMTTGGGGYTFYKHDTGGSLLSAPEAEAVCADVGMQLFVPRTELHLQSAYAVATSATIGPSANWLYLRIFGIYPDTRGARCNLMEFNSENPSCLWGPNDGGPFWISDRTDINDPEGANSTVHSANFSFNGGDYLVDDYGNGWPGALSRRFMCQTGDKWGP